MMDSEYMLQEFVDRFGPRMAHMGGILHMVSSLSAQKDAPPAAPRASDAIAGRAQLDPVTQPVEYFGKPRTVARFDVDSLVAAARQARGTIVMACAVGDTLVDGDVLLRVHDAGTPLPERALLRAVQLGKERIRNAIDVWRDDLKGERFLLDGEEIIA